MANKNEVDFFYELQVLLTRLPAFTLFHNVKNAYWTEFTQGCIYGCLTRFRINYVLSSRGRNGYFS